MTPVLTSAKLNAIPGILFFLLGFPAQLGPQPRSLRRPMFEHTEIEYVGSISACGCADRHQLFYS
jgi:hypothetical protein